jgi:hypothetical protein
MKVAFETELEIMDLMYNMVDWLKLDEDNNEEMDDKEDNDMDQNEFFDVCLDFDLDNYFFFVDFFFLFFVVQYYQR